MKIWLDDTRVAPEGWTWVKDYYEFYRLIDKCEVIENVSFDYYLGFSRGKDNLTGFDCAKILEMYVRRGDIIVNNWAVHSTHETGANQIKQFLTERLGPIEN